jgi:hypothetical protein
MLKPTLCTAIAILFVACATWADPTTGPSGTIVGNWKWNISVQDNSIDMSAKLKLDGDKITGTFLDGFDNTSYDVTNGKLDGQNVTFTITRPLQDQKIESTYTGKLDGDTIKGSIDVHLGDQDPMKIDWSAKRVSDDAATTMPSKQ